MTWHYQGYWWPRWGVVNRQRLPQLANKHEAATVAYSATLAAALAGSAGIDAYVASAFSVGDSVGCQAETAADVSQNVAPSDEVLGVLQAAGALTESSVLTEQLAAYAQTGAAVAQLLNTAGLVTAYATAVASVQVTCSVDGALIPIAHAQGIYVELASIVDETLAALAAAAVFSDTVASTAQFISSAQGSSTISAALDLIKTLVAQASSVEGLSNGVEVGGTSYGVASALTSMETPGSINASITGVFNATQILSESTTLEGVLTAVASLLADVSQAVSADLEPHAQSSALSEINAPVSITAPQQVGTGNSLSIVEIVIVDLTHAASVSAYGLLSEAVQWAATVDSGGSQTAELVTQLDAAQTLVDSAAALASVDYATAIEDATTSVCLALAELLAATPAAGSDLAVSAETAAILEVTSVTLAALEVLANAQATHAAATAVDVIPTGVVRHPVLYSSSVSVEAQLFSQATAAAILAGDVELLDALQTTLASTAELTPTELAVLLATAALASNDQLVAQRIDLDGAWLTYELPGYLAVAIELDGTVTVVPCDGELLT